MTSRNRLNGPCVWGLPTGPCADTDSRPYPSGAKCDAHAPWARAGHPEPQTPRKEEDGDRDPRERDNLPDADEVEVRDA